MYSVLIVDDEPEIRQGLRLKVDWSGLGLSIAGEAGNGADAIEWLANHPVDIVITDMNMPVMNGVSFLEICHELHPSLRLIVITGYEDFQYAKAAIRHQAKDYLLKPVTQDELREALLKVVRELNEQRNKRDQQAMMQWRLSQYYKEMKEHFIVHLVNEELERETMIRERAKLFQFDTWEERHVRFVTAGLIDRTGAGGQEERSPHKMRLPLEMVCREVAESSPQQVQAFRDANYSGFIHFITAISDEDLNVFVDTLRIAVTEHLGFQPSIAIGKSVTGLRQWKDGYLSSLLEWNMKGNKAPHDMHTAKAQQFLYKLAHKIVRGSENNPAEAEQSIIQAAEQYIHDNYMYDINLTMLAERFNYNSSYFSEMFKAKAGKTFIQYITDVRMAKAVQLLEETMLSLWDIAELTGFTNASYFSSKFKRLYGMPPSEYRLRKEPEKFDNQEPKK
ncbi:response regulator transcription factor [Paenibacillus sedimenti]|uniref:Response regulator n=1 Tax=Paenibacillus sedimenti TaxID=2770274 RepID=A0A926KRW4_9BACL|nr:response regulator [Paenibacillus sedimenti]MBD0382967.1 response regulator [Paenibacillus sedimenti]